MGCNAALHIYVSLNLVPWITINYSQEPLLQYSSLLCLETKQ